jgi:hypothetical protein
MTPYSVDDQPLYDMETSSLALTPFPLLFAVVVGFFIISFLVALSFRRFKSTMPLVGSWGAATSAACHPPKDDTDTAALGQLAWGETDPPPDWDIDQSGYEDHEGQCSFTSLDAVQPASPILYA